jgi:hypothetical protein
VSGEVKDKLNGLEKVVVVEVELKVWKVAERTGI